MTIPDLVPWLIGLALILLVGFLYWAERRYPGPLKPRERTHYLTYCAWCIHCHGDDCTHPGSPVNQPRRRSALTWLEAYLAVLTHRELPQAHYL